MALDIQFVDPLGTIQAVLPLEREVFETLHPYLNGYSAPNRLSRLSDYHTDVLWSERETPQLRREVVELHERLQERASSDNQAARDFLWRFEQFLRRAELQGLQVRTLAEDGPQPKGR